MWATSLGTVTCTWRRDEQEHTQTKPSQGLLWRPPPLCWMSTGAPTHWYLGHVSEHPHCKDGGLKYSHLPKAEMGFVSWLSQVLSSE